MLIHRGHKMKRVLHHCNFNPYSSIGFRVLKYPHPYLDEAGFVKFILSRVCKMKHKAPYNVNIVKNTDNYPTKLKKYGYSNSIFYV